jgi:hypothetical protein
LQFTLCAILALCVLLWYNGVFFCCRVHYRVIVCCVFHFEPFLCCCWCTAGVLFAYLSVCCLAKHSFNVLSLLVEYPFSLLGGQLECVRQKAFIVDCIIIFRDFVHHCYIHNIQVVFHIAQSGFDIIWQYSLMLLCCFFSSFFCYLCLMLPYGLPEPCGCRSLMMPFLLSLSWSSLCSLFSPSMQWIFRIFALSPIIGINYWSRRSGWKGEPFAHSIISVAPRITGALLFVFRVLLGGFVLSAPWFYWRKKNRLSYMVMCPLERDCISSWVVIAVHDRSVVSSDLLLVKALMIVTSVCWC